MTPPRAIVRLRTDADLTDCASLLRAVHEFDGYPAALPADVNAWLTPRGLLSAWVAQLDPVVCGHVVVGRVDQSSDPQLAAASQRPAMQLAEIKRLFVEPSARGGGIGKMLLDRAVNAARAAGLHPVLEVTADRASAIRFYEGCGWRRIGTIHATWTRPSGEHPLLHQYEPPL